MTNDHNPRPAPLAWIELQCRRTALGLNQAQFAKFLGVKQVTVSRWELGEQVIPAGIGNQLMDVERNVHAAATRMVDAATAAPPGVQIWLHAATTTDPDTWCQWDGLDVPALAQRVGVARAWADLTFRHHHTPRITTLDADESPWITTTSHPPAHQGENT